MRTYYYIFNFLYLCHFRKAPLDILAISLSCCTLSLCITLNECRDNPHMTNYNQSYWLSPNVANINYVQTWLLLYNSHFFPRLNGFKQRHTLIFQNLSQEAESGKNMVLVFVSSYLGS